jgi:hypothetical protein
MENPLALITSLASRKNSNEFKGVVKRDWVPTGRIDFGTKLDSNAEPGQPGGFKLLIEEQRPATLKEAKSRHDSLPQIPGRKFAHKISTRARNPSTGT